MLKLDDIKAQLGEGAGYSDDLICEALAAETAAQVSVCDLPARRTAADTKALDEALSRRVSLTLAGSDGKAVKRRLGGADEQVRALERPYSKRRAADQDEPAPKKTSGGRRRRTTSSGTTKGK